MTKVRLNGSTDRTRGHVTPSESDAKCPFFKERFFEWGASHERRACCEMKEGAAVCDYQLIQNDGTPICARYAYGPDYEVVLKPGAIIDDTFEPIPFIKAMTKKDADGNVRQTHKQWISTQYIDTHEKKFRIRNGELGWFHNV